MLLIPRLAIKKALICQKVSVFSIIYLHRCYLQSLHHHRQQLTHADLLATTFYHWHPEAHYHMTEKRIMRD